MFKIEISKVSSSALAAEICTGPHNRLLRRQHCSSLCSQSEGHEHVANMASALEHDFVGFSARAWSPQYSPPHFASKVSYSASPQTSAKCLRGATCSDSIPVMRFGQKPRRLVFEFKRPPLTPKPPFLALSLSANLGADASESGSRHDRIWEQTRSPLGAETPTSIGNEKAGCCELCPSITSRAALWPAMQGSALFIMGKPRSLG